VICWALTMGDDIGGNEVRSPKKWLYPEYQLMAPQQLT
jgi:hypothetical protein